MLVKWPLVLLLLQLLSPLGSSAETQPALLQHPKCHLSLTLFNQALSAWLLFLAHSELKARLPALCQHPVPVFLIGSELGYVVFEFSEYSAYPQTDAT